MMPGHDGSGWLAQRMKSGWGGFAGSAGRKFIFWIQCTSICNLLSYGSIHMRVDGVFVGTVNLNLSHYRNKMK